MGLCLVGTCPLCWVKTFCHQMSLLRYVKCLPQSPLENNWHDRELGLFYIRLMKSLSQSEHSMSKYIFPSVSAVLFYRQYSFKFKKKIQKSKIQIKIKNYLIRKCLAVSNLGVKAKRWQNPLYLKVHGSLEENCFPRTNCPRIRRNAANWQRRVKTLLWEAMLGQWSVVQQCPFFKGGTVFIVV